MCNIVILGITKTKADKPNKKGLRRDFASRGQESSDSAFLSNRIKCKCIFVSFDNSPINCMIIERYRNIALKKLSKISAKHSLLLNIWSFGHFHFIFILLFFSSQETQINISHGLPPCKALILSQFTYLKSFFVNVE